MSGYNDSEVWADYGDGQQELDPHNAAFLDNPTEYLRAVIGQSADDIEARIRGEVQHRVQQVQQAQAEQHQAIIQQQQAEVFSAMDEAHPGWREYAPQIVETIVREDSDPQAAAELLQQKYFALKGMKETDIRRAAEERERRHNTDALKAAGPPIDDYLYGR